MKLLVFIGILVLTFACTRQVVEEQMQNQTIQFADPAKYNMKILPDKPGSKDEIKLVIFDDCTYNVLSGVTRKGQTIDIRKQFNSMMKWPCMMKNDTILIGKLPEGVYNVNYTLIDISQLPPKDISLSFTFRLEVSR